MGVRERTRAISLSQDCRTDFPPLQRNPPAQAHTAPDTRRPVFFGYLHSEVGSGVRIAGKTGGSETVEYGPHIPTLVEIAESGGLD